MEEDSSVCSSEVLTPLRQVSLLSSEFTTKERLGICCKPFFQFRRLKNKGAILVLVWNYLCISLLSFYQKIGQGLPVALISTEIIALGLTLSIAGWIADVHFGRYRVIYLSIWIMWAALMLTTVSSVLTKAVVSYASIHRYVDGVFGIIVAVGFGGFQANIIQFGLDQLHDSSTKEIASFILWYVWTFYSSPFVVDFILGYLPNQYQLLGDLVMCIYLSLAVSLMLVFNHWLVKEPVTQIL